MLEGENDFAWALAVLLRGRKGQPYQPHPLAAPTLTIHLPTKPATMILYQTFSQTSHRKRDPAGWVSMDGQLSLLMASSQVTRSRAMTYSNPINLLPGLRRKGRITQL